MFPEEYSAIVNAARRMGEGGLPCDEAALQAFWAAGGCVKQPLTSLQGHHLEILAPGWRNASEGPDFLNAQILFNGVLHTGDVEIHLSASGWRAHGHHHDSRYDRVILHVVLKAGEGSDAGLGGVTASGRKVATLLLDPRAVDTWTPETPDDVSAPLGRCAQGAGPGGEARMLALLHLAAAWRMVGKAHALAERAAAVGDDQAIYELFLGACGYARFSTHFQALARALPYDRARQLALQDPLLLETALLQLAGLLPGTAPPGMDASGAAHYEKLCALRSEHLAGLRTLDLDWRVGGVRPLNRPERRIAGAVRVVSRTAATGLVESLRRVWRDPMPPLKRRRAFEELFRAPLGFWASHCTWTAKPMQRPTAVLGADRVRAIIGNVCLSHGLMLARRERNLALEEMVLACYNRLSAESGNLTVRRMATRLFGDDPPKMAFALQQGMIQLYQDWCRDNVACHHCPVLQFLNAGRLP